MVGDLRQTKITSYSEDRFGVPLKYLEDELHTNISDSKTSEENTSLKRRKIDVLTFKTEDPTMSDSTDDESPYAIMRKKAIEEREKLLRNIGILEVKQEVKEIDIELKKRKREQTKKQEPHFKLRTLPPRRASLRLKGLLPDGEIIKTESVQAEDPEESVRKSADPISMKNETNDSDSENVCNDYLLNLRPHLTGGKYETALESDSLDSFKGRVRKLKLSPRRIRKIVKGRISSASVHPSETKLLIAAGDKYGNLGLWDVESDNESMLFEPHARGISCVTFSRYNAEKIISTSFDGTVRFGDLNKEVFIQVYASDEDMSYNHTCWHAEVNPNVLLIAHGSGEVGSFDLRAGNLSAMYKCHERSVRTVQPHPLDENCFLTSSGKGEARIWDIRKTKAAQLCEFKHTKTLSGAFFSPAGSYVLTTCADDRLRVYDTGKFRNEIPKVVMNIKHNNFTGRWLTPFRAKWHPQREDVFVVGSMERPRRVEIYGIHGKVVHELSDPNLDIVLSVCEFHPSQLVLAGGSSTGKMFVFI